MNYLFLTYQQKRERIHEKRIINNDYVEYYEY